MSAWIVSKGHIDALVQSLMVEGLIEPAQADEVGAMLWRENHRSVNYRYREQTETPEYKFRGIESPLHPAKVCHLIHCYHYQCMEWDAFEDEPGMKLVMELDHRLGTAAGFEDGHAFTSDHETRHNVNLPWGINEIEEAV